MTITRKINWPRILAEGTVIVVSILLAFGIEAWWEETNQEEQRQSHISALIRDFQQMSERATASHVNATRAVDSGFTLLAGLSARRNWENESAMQTMMNIQYYEVFSPSIGGYESLVSTGAIELFEDNSLKRELVEFFGSFEDMRVSEQLLVNNVMEFLRSPEYGYLVGVHRLPVPAFPGFDVAPVEDWNDSVFLRNSIALITLGQRDVMEDYEYLLDRLKSIQDGLAKEANAR